MMARVETVVVPKPEFDALVAEVERLRANEKMLVETAKNRLREVERLQTENDGMRSQVGPVTTQNRELLNEVERLRAALNRAGDRLAQVQPGVTEPWAFDIIPKAEQEIADALDG